MAAGTDPDEPDDDPDIEFDSADGPLSGCPFCGSNDDSCPHFFGSQDLNYGGGFSVDFGPLTDLQELLDQLRDGADAFLQLPNQKARVAVLIPHRLRDLVQAVASGDESDGFSRYVERLGRDSKVRVEARAHTEKEGGPGMCSVIQMFWAADVPLVLLGMRPRIERDVQRLQKQTVRT